ncbi:hypothetical protein SDC9_100962 [bioreactor metagenome]|uniref:Uncharacterized protein n=1 Tax=bioreactor metagenome TaxID=1076179 RepID=A0A645AN49_9ZZZZ
MRGEGYFFPVNFRQNDIRQRQPGNNRNILEQGSLLFLLSPCFQGIHREVVQVLRSGGAGIVPVPRRGHRSKHGVILLVVRIKNQVAVHLLKNRIVCRRTRRIAQYQFGDFRLVRCQDGVELGQVSHVVNSLGCMFFFRFTDPDVDLTGLGIDLPDLLVHGRVFDGQRTRQVFRIAPDLQSLYRVDGKNSHLAPYPQLVKFGIYGGLFFKCKLPVLFQLNRIEQFNTTQATVLQV